MTDMIYILLIVLQTGLETCLPLSSAGALKKVLNKPYQNVLKLVRQTILIIVKRIVWMYSLPWWFLDMRLRLLTWVIGVGLLYLS